MLKPLTALLITTAPLLSLLNPLPASAGRCNYPDDLDSAGHLCGGRAASVRPGGYEPPPEEQQQNNSLPEYDGNTPVALGWKTFQIFDPPSNCRADASASSPIVMTYTQKGEITIDSFEKDGNGDIWYHSPYNHCFIHESQVTR